MRLKISKSSGADEKKKIYSSNFFKEEAPIDVENMCAPIDYVWQNDRSPLGLKLIKTWKIFLIYTRYERNNLFHVLLTGCLILDDKIIKIFCYNKITLKVKKDFIKLISARIDSCDWFFSNILIKFHYFDIIKYCTNPEFQIPIIVSALQFRKLSVSIQN